MRLFFALAILIFLALSSPTPTLAQVWEDGCTIDGVATIQGIKCLVVNIIQVAIRLIGVAAFIMFAIGGLKILTSGGDPKGVQAGQQTLTLAAAGIFLAVLAYFVLWLIQQITGAPVTIFVVPESRY